jgi:hypothetical protein
MADQNPSTLLLRIIADELYVARKDKDEGNRVSGQLSPWMDGGERNAVTTNIHARREQVDRLMIDAEAHFQNTPPR